MIHEYLRLIREGISARKRGDMAAYYSGLEQLSAIWEELSDEDAVVARREARNIAIRSRAPLEAKTSGDAIVIVVGEQARICGSIRSFEFPVLRVGTLWGETNTIESLPRTSLVPKFAQTMVA